MNKALGILFVKQFYRLNLGFFLVCFFILFGILNARDMLYFHYGIMQQAHTYRMLLILGSVWLLYALKCFGFAQGVLTTPAASFLYQLQGWTNKRLLLTFSILQLLVYLPALVYAIITAIVQTMHGHIATALFVLLMQSVLIVAPAYWHVARVNGSYIPQKHGSLSNFLRRFAFEKKFWSWLLQYLIHDRKAALLGIKIGSLILLQAMVTINSEQLNFESVSYLMLALIAAHAILPYYLREFIEVRLRFVRAMPIALTRRYAWFCLTYAVLMLPEFLFLLLHVNSAIPAIMLGLIYIVAVIQLCLYSSLLYLPGMTIEKYMLFTAVLFFASILFLAAFPLWQFALAIAILSFALFAIFYEQWEATLN